MELPHPPAELVADYEDQILSIGAPYDTITRSLKADTHQYLEEY